MAEVSTEAEKKGKDELMASMIDLTESLERYRDHGCETGSGLRAVLENDLHQTICRCDLETLALLMPLMRWIEQNLPPESYGTREKVKSWIRAKRLQEAQLRG